MQKSHQNVSIILSIPIIYSFLFFARTYSQGRKSSIIPHTGKDGRESLNLSKLKLMNFTSSCPNFHIPPYIGVNISKRKSGTKWTKKRASRNLRPPSSIFVTARVRNWYCAWHWQIHVAAVVCLKYKLKMVLTSK